MKTLLSLLLLTSINITYAAQTCYNDVINNTPDSRYTNNDNGTITDNISKLIWKQCSEGQTWMDASPDSCTGTASTKTWQAALILADSATFTNNPNWQLPNIKQLKSIIAYNCFGSSINENYFPNTPTEDFWSSSPSASDSSNAWIAQFNYGYIHDGNRGSGHFVRLVRPMP